MKKCLKRRVFPLVGAIVLLIGALIVPVGAAVPAGPSLVNFCKTISFACYDWYDGATMSCTNTPSSGKLSFAYGGSRYGLLSVESRDVTFGDLFPNAVPGRTYVINFDYQRCSDPYFAFWGSSGHIASLRPGASFVWTKEMAEAGFVLSVSISQNVQDFELTNFVLLQHDSIGSFSAAAFFTPYDEIYFETPDIGDLEILFRKEGYDTGYAAGKKDGMLIADTGDFSSLITSVVDAPVRAFTSLFDFEILGQNMLSFVGALMSLCLIIFILKRVI